MNKMDKFIQDHKGKSLQLKKIKKKLKFKAHNSVPLSTLEELLKFEKDNEVNALHYITLTTLLVWMTALMEGQNNVKKLA